MAQGDSWICPNCGNTNRPGARFCSRCRTPNPALAGTATQRMEGAPAAPARAPARPGPPAPGSAARAARGGCRARRRCQCRRAGTAQPGRQRAVRGAATMAALALPAIARAAKCGEPGGRHAVARMDHRAGLRPGLPDAGRRAAQPLQALQHQLRRSQRPGQKHAGQRADRRGLFARGVPRAGHGGSDPRAPPARPPAGRGPGPRRGARPGQRHRAGRVF